MGRKSENAIVNTLKKCSCQCPDIFMVEFEKIFGYWVILELAFLHFFIVAFN